MDFIVITHNLHPIMGYISLRGVTMKPIPKYVYWITKYKN